MTAETRCDSIFTMEPQAIAAALETREMHKPRVVILGGRVAGLTAAYELRRRLGDRVQITVVSASERSTLRSDGSEPMLHTLLTDLPHYRPCRPGNRASSAAVAARILEGLPAACWREADLTSIHCNDRLLRLYERFMDPPRARR